MLAARCTYRPNMGWCEVTSTARLQTCDRRDLRDMGASGQWSSITGFQTGSMRVLRAAEFSVQTTPV